MLCFLLLSTTAPHTFILYHYIVYMYRLQRFRLDVKPIYGSKVGFTTIMHVLQNITHDDFRDAFESQNKLNTRKEFHKPNEFFAIKKTRILSLTITFFWLRNVLQWYIDYVTSLPHFG